MTAAPGPIVIGHAGAGGEAPANTLAAVRACLASGAAAMEIDLRLSADRVPVLMHDATLDRTTNRSGPVASFTAAELGGMDAGGGEPVPAFSDVLDLVAGRIAVFAELKAATGDPVEDARLAAEAVGVIDAHEAASWAGVHSFSPPIIEAVREANPRISTAIISPPVDDAGAQRLLAAAVKRGAQAVSLEHSSVTADFVRRARWRQITVWAWTADEEGAWDALIAAGADGIITNVPSRLMRHLGRQ